MPTTVSVIAQTSRPQVVRVSASQQASSPFAPLKKHFAVPAVVAGLIAGQLHFLAPGPAVAEVYPANQSIDLVSVADAGEVLAEIESEEIPQLEAKLGKLSNSMGPTETIASAQRELEAIEQEAAALSEEEAKGPSSDFKSEMGGLLNTVSTFKGIMQGMQ